MCTVAVSRGDRAIYNAPALVALIVPRRPRTPSTGAAVARLDTACGGPTGRLAQVCPARLRQALHPQNTIVEVGRG